MPQIRLASDLIKPRAVLAAVKSASRRLAAVAFGLDLDRRCARRGFPPQAGDEETAFQPN
jgi:hypothetical protein